MVPGPTKTGGIVVHADFKAGALKNGQRMHRIFTAPAQKYAITKDLALKLSRDSFFVSLIASHGLNNLDQMGEKISNSESSAFYIEKGNEESALRLFARFLVEKRQDSMAFVISSLEEMGREGKGLGEEVEVLFEGRQQSLPVRSIDEHMRQLAEDGQAQRLIDFAYDGYEAVALSAIDCLTNFTSKEVRIALKRIYVNFERSEGRIAVRALHSLACLQSGADFLADRLFDEGRRIVSRFRESDLPAGALYELNLDLYIIFRSLGLIQRASVAYELFMCLSAEQRRLLLQGLKEDSNNSVLVLADTLEHY